MCDNCSYYDPVKLDTAKEETSSLEKEFVLPNVVPDAHFPVDQKHNIEVVEKDSGFRILIIKLDAVGDVLRTTSLLHALKKQYPASHISWLTKENAKNIFKNNKFVD